MNIDRTRRELAEMEKNPRIAAAFQKIRAAAHEAVFEPKFESGWGQLRVKREGDVIEIEWKSLLHNRDYTMVGSILKVAFFSQDEFEENNILPNKRGDGRITITLEQGCLYHCRIFLIEEATENPLGFTFQIGIPLSPERRALLDRAILEDEHPEEKADRDLKRFLKLQKTFDKRYKTAVAQIKAKKLPAEEKEDQIQRFREYAESLKDILKI